MTTEAHFIVPPLANLCLAYLVDNPKVLETSKPHLPLSVTELIINFIISKKIDNLDLFRFLPNAQQMTTLNLSNHRHVTPELLLQLPLLFPRLAYLDLENCSISETEIFKNFTQLKKLNAKGTQINETAARRLSKAFEGLEVCLQGLSFITFTSRS
ncbi:MAG: hypothetical protein JSS10_07260 [Verrucomicrobia bacterium]|nr:hypothetical protein [Verrucomicrobiota bacterium]